MVAGRPTPKALEARHDTRKALMAALREIRAARKSIVKSGTIRGYIPPTSSYPPQSTGTPCKTAISPKILSQAILLYPPHVPIFRCGRFLHPPYVPTSICGIPPRLIPVRLKDFKMALDAIELWIRYLLNVYDKINAKRPARPKLKPRR